MVGLLSGKYSQSERQTQEALEDFFQVEVALGTVNNLRQEVSQSLAAPVEEATKFAQAQKEANADETGWRQGNSDGKNPTQRKAWLWVMVTSYVTVFQIHLNRGHAAAKLLLGKFAGYLTTDRWTGYSWWPLDRRQLCWAHLIREFQKIADRGGESKAIGEALLAQARQLFELWHCVRDGTLSREGFAAAVIEIRAAIKKRLEEGASYKAVLGDKSVRAKTGDRVPTVYPENGRVVGLDVADPIRVDYSKKIGDWPTGRENLELLKMHPSHGHDMTIVNGVSRIGYMTGGKSALWKDEDMADLYTGKAISFIEQNKNKAFFLYFATHDPHVPRLPHLRFAGKSGMGPRGESYTSRQHVFAERGAHASGLPTRTSPFDLGRVVIGKRYKLIYNALWQ